MLIDSNIIIYSAQPENAQLRDLTELCCTFGGRSGVPNIAVFILKIVLRNILHCLKQN